MNSIQFRAVTVSVDGEVQEVQWDTTDGTLQHLQRAVGGLVDVVGLAPNLDMWVNDEGLALGMEVNHLATVAAQVCGKFRQPYAGPAVFTGGADENGETLPLTAEQAAALRDLLHRAANTVT